MNSYDSFWNDVAEESAPTIYQKVAAKFATDDEPDVSEHMPTDEELRAIEEGNEAEDVGQVPQPAFESPQHAQQAVENSEVGDLVGKDPRHLELLQHHDLERGVQDVTQGRETVPARSAPEGGEGAYSPAVTSLAREIFGGGKAAEDRIKGEVARIRRYEETQGISPEDSGLQPHHIDRILDKLHASGQTVVGTSYPKCPSCGQFGINYQKGGYICRYCGAHPSYDSIFAKP